MSDSPCNLTAFVREGSSDASGVTCAAVRVRRASSSLKRKFRKEWAQQATSDARSARSEHTQSRTSCLRLVAHERVMPVVRHSRVALIFSEMMFSATRKSRKRTVQLSHLLENDTDDDLPQPCTAAKLAKPVAKQERLSFSLPAELLQACFLRVDDHRTLCSAAQVSASMRPC